MGQNLLFRLKRKSNIFLVILSLIGGMLVQFSTNRYGEGLSPDSVGYIGIARNLIAGNGFIGFNGYPVISHPPLYPILLAFWGIIFCKDPDPLLYSNIVNALIFSFIVYSGGLLSFKYLSSSPHYAIIGSIAILFSFPINGVSLMAWSEPLFILFVVLSFHSIESYLEKNNTSSLLLFSILVALSTLTRYIGVVLILWGGFLVAFQRNTIKKRIMHLALFSLLSTLPIGLLMARNYSISNTLLGYRRESIFSLSQNIEYVYNTINNWFFPEIIGDYRIVLIFIFVFIIYKIRFRSKFGNQKRSLEKHNKNFHITLFIVVYTTFLIISSTLVAYDKIADRLLSPIYIPLILLILFYTIEFVAPFQERFSTPVIKMFPKIIIIFSLVVLPFFNSLVLFINQSFFGSGFSGKVWVESEMIQYLRNHQPDLYDCALFSNGPDAIYILTGLDTNMSLVNPTYYSLDENYKISDHINNWLAEDNVCLIWFENIDREYLVSPSELLIVSNLREIALFDDGTVYYVTKK